MLARNVARARALEARVTAAQERLAKAQARFHRAQRVLARRLVAIYKSDAPDLTTVLLEADGFSDLLTRTEYLQQINDADTVLVNRVQALRNQVRVRARPRARRPCAGRRGGPARGRRPRRDRRHPRGRLRAGRGAGPRPGRPARLAVDPALAHGRLGGSRSASCRRRWARRATPRAAVQQWFDGFAIPKAIVMCESGGNYGALNPSSGAGGAYQFLPETYKGLGGQARGAAPGAQVGAGPARREALGRRPGPRQLGVLGRRAGRRDNSGSEWEHRWHLARVAFLVGSGRPPTDSLATRAITH